MLKAAYSYGLRHITVRQPPQSCLLWLVTSPGLIGRLLSGIAGRDSLHIRPALRCLTDDLSAPWSWEQSAHSDGLIEGCPLRPGGVCNSGWAPRQPHPGVLREHEPVSLNRYGDWHLNRALDVVARPRSLTDTATRAYVRRRTAEGRSPREIRRCLKRFIARQIYRQLQTLTA